MVSLPIRVYPDPILFQKTEAVRTFDASLHKFLDSMIETMYEANGIGLAAPQVGMPSQALVLDISRNQTEPRVFINPTISSSEGEVPSEEGCLSIPNYRDTIQRAERIVVVAQDRNGNQFEEEATGLLAICLQHEIDHLNGILFVDHLSRLKRDLFRRWAKKQLRDDQG